jgi:hypothetical protein
MLCYHSIYLDVGWFLELHYKVFSPFSKYSIHFQVVITMLWLFVLYWCMVYHIECVLQNHHFIFQHLRVALIHISMHQLWHLQVDIHMLLEIELLLCWLFLMSSWFLLILLILLLVLIVLVRIWLEIVVRAFTLKFEWLLLHGLWCKRLMVLTSILLRLLPIHNLLTLHFRLLLLLLIILLVLSLNYLLWYLFRNYGCHLP